MSKKGVVLDNFDIKNASADELWDWYILEYQSRNPISNMLYNNFYNNLKKLLSELEGVNKYLEIGCGTGESTKRLLGMIGEDCHLESSEYEQRLVQKLNSINFPVNVIEESVYELKRENHSCDCILLLEVLEHLDDYELALKELFRVSGRYVIISVPNEPMWRILNMMRGNYWSDWGNTPGHINHWSPSRLKALLTEYGDVVMTLTPTPWIMMLVKVK